MDCPYLVPLATIEEPTARLGRPAPNLLEEEGDASGETLVANASGPIEIQGAVIRTAFTSHDPPSNPVKIEAERAEEGLAGEETHIGWHKLQVANPVAHGLVLDRCAYPDVLGDEAAAQASGVALPKPGGSCWALGQHLVDVPVRRQHDLEHLTNERFGNVLVKQI